MLKLLIQTSGNPNALMGGRKGGGFVCITTTAPTADSAQTGSGASRRILAAATGKTML